MRAARCLFPVIFLFGAVSVFAQALPSDPQEVCTADIAPWFQSGSVTRNGFVTPADSVNFVRENNCDFYRWAEHMFLWMTSPAPSIYGESSLVFQSLVFFGITSGSGGDLQFVPQIPERIFQADAKTKSRAWKLPPLTGAREMKQIHAALRPAKRGPNGLPVVIDRKGRAIEITDAQLSRRGKPVVVGPNGRVEVSKVIRDALTQKVKFVDAAGKVIANPKPFLIARLRKALIGQRFFTTDGTPIIVDSNGKVIDVSPKQAGEFGNVLLSQSNSVIYYTTFVNDVFAFFRTGVENGQIRTIDHKEPTQFPTTKFDLEQITNYLAKYDVTLTDANALAVEVKMSWIDASTLSNPDDYITIYAEVPVYDKSKSQSWPQVTTKITKLALLGVHVVGSTSGHPEMVWATFEHFGNTANAQYEYVNKSGSTVSKPQDTKGSWLFTKTNSSSGFNVPHANYVDAPTITAEEGLTISGSNTLRQNPFGVAPVGVPNQRDQTPAIANTVVLSINNSVLGQLKSGDVRKNYYFVGSTWALGGDWPSGPYPKGNEIGTSHLTNSTLETYDQGDGPSDPGSNCFGCHRTNTTYVSHIYSDLRPLYKSTTKAKAAVKKSKK